MYQLCSSPSDPPGLYFLPEGARCPQVRHVSLPCKTSSRFSREPHVLFFSRTTRFVACPSGASESSKIKNFSEKPESPAGRGISFYISAVFAPACKRAKIMSESTSPHRSIADFFFVMGAEALSFPCKIYFYSPLPKEGALGQAETSRRVTRTLLFPGISLPLPCEHAHGLFPPGRSVRI